MFSQDEPDGINDASLLPDESAVGPINDASITEPEIGVDTEEIGLDDDEGTSTYPVPDDKRIGISTDEGTNPDSTDQNDEANDAVLWGTPDDVYSDSIYPLPKEDSEGTKGTEVL